MDDVKLKPVKNGWVVYFKGKYYGSVRWKRSQRLWMAYRDGYPVGSSGEQNEAIAIVIQEKPKGW